MTLLQDVFTYAFRGSGKYILLIGAILSVVADLVSWAPAIGAIAGLILFGYFCALYFEVIQTTATGSSEAPEYPATSNLMEDLIWPALQIIIVLLVSLSPYFAYHWSIQASQQSMSIRLGLLGLGIAYFPMAMLGVVVLGRISAISPHIVIPSIVRAGGLYWLAVFLLLFLYLGEAHLGGALKGLPIVNSLVMAVVGTYTLLTNGRLLGIIYRERSEELNWL